MATVLPGFDKFQGLRGFADNFVKGIIQNQQNQAFSQQLGQVLGQPGLTQGITNPRALQAAGQVGLGNIQQDRALAQRQATPPTETQVKAKQLNESLRKSHENRTQFDNDVINSSFGITPEIIKDGFTEVVVNPATGEPELTLFNQDGTVRSRLGKPTITPSQQLNQFAVDEVRGIEAKIRAGRATEADIKRKQELISGGGQQININTGQVAATVQEQLPQLRAGQDAVNAFKDDPANKAILIDNDISVATDSKGNLQLLVKPKAAPGEGALKEFGDLISLRDSAVSAEVFFEPSFVGIVQGSDFLNAFERKTGFFTNAKEISFKRIVNDLSDRLLRARSGAQINEEEFRRLTKIVPRLDTSEKAFKAEVRSFIEELNSIIKIKQTLSEQAGKRGLRDPSAKTATTPTTQAEFDAIPAGTEFIDTDGTRKVKQ